MRHEEVQQAQLGGPQVDRLVARAHLVRRRVDAQAGDLDHVVGELRRAPAHDRLDARQQLARGERLGDVVVAPLSSAVTLSCSSARAESSTMEMSLVRWSPRSRRAKVAGNARQHPVQIQITSGDWA